LLKANEPIDKNGRFVNKIITARSRGDLVQVSPLEIAYMDVAPTQLVSVAASLIPFLEHDDANRALMGSNMQRQAVPLLETDAPIIGTGVLKEQQQSIHMLRLPLKEQEQSNL